MTAHHDLDRQLNAFLSDGPVTLPDESFDAVRDRTEQTRQRVVLGPWRVPTVSKLVPIGLGAAAVIAVLFLGSQFIGSPTSNVGGPASQPPASAAPSEAPASAAPSPISPPPLTQSFTSQMHGFSVSYPEGWTARAATEPWTGTGGPHFPDPYADLLIDPALEDHLFLVFGSQPIGNSTPDEWVAETMAADECSATEPIAVDGATGLIGDCEVVAVTTAGRGYRIRLFTSGEVPPDAVAPYDRAWFEEVLATVQLQPEDAVDVAPSAPPLTQSFTSPLHGISLSYPEGWTAEAATEPWTESTYSLLFDPRTPYIDYLFDPILGDHLFLNMASQPIGEATPEEWMATQIEDCTATGPIEVDSATGLIGGEGCDEAVVTIGGRGYHIQLNASDDDPAAVAPYDRAWFEEVLATVQLHPEDVDEAPSPSP